MIYVRTDSSILKQKWPFSEPTLPHSLRSIQMVNEPVNIFCNIYMIFFSLVCRHVLFTIDTIPLWFDYYLNEGEFIKRQTTMHHAIFDWLKKVYSCVKSTWKVDVEFKSLVHNLKWFFNRIFLSKFYTCTKKEERIKFQTKTMNTYLLLFTIQKILVEKWAKSLLLCPPPFTLDTVC